MRRALFPSGFLSPGEKITKNKKAVRSDLVDVYESVAKQGKVIESSGRFVLIMLPDNSAVYEWFMTTTTIDQIWSFVEAIRPEYNRRDFYLADPIVSRDNVTGSDDGALPDSVTTILGLRVFAKSLSEEYVSLSGVNLVSATKCVLQVRKRMERD